MHTVAVSYLDTIRPLNSTVTNRAKLPFNARLGFKDIFDKIGHLYAFVRFDLFASIEFRNIFGLVDLFCD